VWHYLENVKHWIGRRHRPWQVRNPQKAETARQGVIFLLVVAYPLLGACFACCNAQVLPAAAGGSPKIQLITGAAHSIAKSKVSPRWKFPLDLAKGKIPKTHPGFEGGKRARRVPLT